MDSGSVPQYGAPSGYGQGGYGAPAPAGWYPDPYGSGQPRYWDGTAWGALALGAPPAKTGTDRLAIAALVLSIIGIVVPAAICAVIALSNISKSKRPGRGLAIAALVVCAVWFAGIAAYVDRHDSSLGSVTDGKVAGTDLIVGQCVEVPDPLPATGRMFDPRSCTSSHNGEVMLSDNLPGQDYPGLEQVKATVKSTCQSELSTYSGADSSSLHVVYLYPTADSWAAGDHGYLCIAVDRAADVTTTLRGSKL